MSPGLALRDTAARHRDDARPLSIRASTRLWTSRRSSVDRSRGRPEGATGDSGGGGGQQASRAAAAGPERAGADHAAGRRRSLARGGRGEWGGPLAPYRRLCLEEADRTAADPGQAHAAGDYRRRATHVGYDEERMGRRSVQP
ncbi:MAG: hypothetical protein MZV70_17225 [Desulfobacterales bacterium]|nr:hypothetical protein [Desulfobacterales bacterium]